MAQGQELSSIRNCLGEDPNRDCSRVPLTESPSLAPRPSEVLVLHGTSGCGKSFLVASALRQHVVVAKEGYFVVGKSDQIRTDQYAAIIAAFSDLIDLVVQGKDLHVRGEEIRKELDNDIHMLSRVLPGLKLLSETTPISDSAHPPRSDETESATQSFTRFRLSRSNLLRALSSSMHPILMFFDDLQWMDKNSLEVI
jgi:predicted ATPase